MKIQNGFVYGIWCLLLNSPYQSMAQNDMHSTINSTPEQDMMMLLKISSFSALFGAAFGAAFLPFMSHPDKLAKKFVFGGASLGFIGGSLMGFYSLFQPVLPINHYSFQNSSSTQSKVKPLYLEDTEHGFYIQKTVKQPLAAQLIVAADSLGVNLVLRF